MAIVDELAVKLQLPPEAQLGKVGEQEAVFYPHAAVQQIGVGEFYALIAGLRFNQLGGYAVVGEDEAVARRGLGLSSPR